mgnify:CR=1 FL=1
MTEILLSELSNSDIEWLKNAGQIQQINADTILIEQQSQVKFFYIVMEGRFIATLNRNQESSRLGSVFAALEDEESLEQEIGQFSSGEILGEMTFINVSSASNTIKALKDSVVLTIPCQYLQNKIEQDFSFASRFYKAISLLLLERFQGLIKLYLKRKLGQITPLNDALLIFGELSDSDVDWLLQNGNVETLKEQTVLLKSGEQVENLYLVLEGVISVAVSEAKKNRFTNIFAELESEDKFSVPLEREISLAHKGEILGEIAPFNSHRSYATLKTIENSTILTIPRQKLLLKLEQDLACASRFYRVIAKLLSGRLQGLISRLGFGKNSYQAGQGLSQDLEYEDEIDLDDLDNLSLGGARFDWLLQRLSYFQK